MSEQAQARLNAHGQPIGAALPDWQARPLPPHAPIAGRHCRIERLQPERHAAALHAAYAGDLKGRLWTYLPYGPFADGPSYRAWMERFCGGSDPLFHAIIDRGSGEPLGVAAYQRIDAAAGALEVGHIALAPALQRSRAATEAMYLLARRAFDELGYRRYEWKCDALNAASRAAAERLGFRYEGCFRQATVYKQRNRDTAWFAIIDRDWPALRTRFEAWLADENFDSDGRQIRRLAEV